MMVHFLNRQVKYAAVEYHRIDDKYVETKMGMIYKIFNAEISGTGCGIIYLKCEVEGTYKSLEKM